MDNLEKAFINRKEIAGDVLKNIEINTINNNDEDRPFDDLIWDIAKVFFKIGLENKQNCIILRYITDNIVGIKYSNQLCKVIIDKIEELKWCNPSFYHKYKMNYIQ